MAKLKNLILNIGAGKMKPLDLPDSYFLINLDKNEYYGQKRMDDALHAVSIYEDDFTSIRSQTIFVKDDVWRFLHSITFSFDRIVLYRFLEHIQREELLYFLYILSTAVNVGGTLDIIVPDHQELASWLVTEKMEDIQDQGHDIIVTTEFLNEPGDPHASLWSPDRAKYYLELEGRFKIDEIQKNFEFDGRDIYLRIKATRIK